MNAGFLSISYVSTPVDGFGLQDLNRLWIECIKKNKAADLTGGLVYLGDQFFQTIEGAENDVARAWRGIQRDPRHGAVEVIMECDPASRSFRDTPMKLINGSEVAWMRQRFARATLREGTLQDLSRTVFRLSTI